MPKCKNCPANDKQDSVMSDMVPLDVSDVDELDDSRTECYGSPADKIDTPESTFELSPSRDSTVERDFNDDNRKLLNDDLLIRDSNFKLNDNLSTKSCDCIIDCECLTKTIPVVPEQRAISVRDKILQDFCEDMSQELSIGSDSITLVKHHSSCSPRSTPQRLPTDFKLCSNPTLSTDILRTQNSESSHGYAKTKRPTSPQPGTSHDTTIPTSITSINSPLHTLSISPAPNSPRLMSPRITHSFRHPSPRKRANLHSPPPRTRAAHKLTLEAEKAYEFTDDAQETCEKLSSFRKRRLADKKYEFREEAEDTENIIPFKHIRDQFEQRPCPIHRSSGAVSPVYSNGKWQRCDAENTEGEDVVTNHEMYNCFQPVDQGKYN